MIYSKFLAYSHYPQMSWQNRGVKEIEAKEMNVATLDKSASKEIKTKPVKEESLSPRDFLKVSRDDIEEAKVIPPKFGSKSLGKIKVVYKHTIYKSVQ